MKKTNFFLFFFHFFFRQIFFSGALKAKLRKIAIWRVSKQAVSLWHVISLHLQVKLANKIHISCLLCSILALRLRNSKLRRTKKSKLWSEFFARNAGTGGGMLIAMALSMGKRLKILDFVDWSIFTESEFLVWNLVRQGRVCRFQWEFLLEYVRKL